MIGGSGVVMASNVNVTTQVLNAVTKQLGKTFGKSFRYYLENVEKNLKPPCFTVDMIDSRSHLRNNGIYDRTLVLVVHYFTDNLLDTKKDSHSIGEQAMECLELLNVDKYAIRGENLSYHMVDDVLQVFVTYRFNTRRVDDGETIYMRNLQEVKSIH